MTNFYKSRKWKRIRKKILRRDNYECQLCKLDGTVTKGNTVHHIKHLGAFPDLALIESNLVTVCKNCHNKLHPEKMKIKPVKTDPITPERW